MTGGVAVRYGERLGPWVGVLLFLHVIAVCVVKVAKGINAEVLWISHVSLALAAVGLMTRSSFLVALSVIFSGVVYSFLKGCRHEYAQKDPFNAACS